MKIYLTIFLFLLYSCANKDSKEQNPEEYYPTFTNDLEDSIQTLELQYIAWACQCANWATPAEINLYQDMDKLSDHSIFIEPQNENLGLPDTLGYSGDLIQFVGQFYKTKGYPKNYPKTEMEVDKAKVFRYTSYKVVRSNYRDFVSDKNNQ